nr:hypothetical protein [Tanacetum cinerariifolium]
MAYMSIPANDVLADQAPAIAPPTRTDDQILPHRKWVPVGKSNYVLDVLRSQRNPIFKVDVAILKNTNFFRAFTTYSSSPIIYIHQFWDTMRHDSTTGIYSLLPSNIIYLYVCPAVGFTCTYTMAYMSIPANDVLADQAPAIAPPTRTDDQILPHRKWVPVGKSNYVLDVLRNVSAKSVNDLYQPWRAILSMINMCLTGKTAGHDRPRHPVLQILWAIIHRSNIDYAERIWEEFVQSIQSFFTDKKRLTMPSQGKKKVTPLLIPGIRFTKLIIHYLKTKNNIHPRTGSPLHYSHADNILGNLKFIGNDGREVYGMPILDALLTDAILGPPYYDGYLAYVAEYQRYLDGKHGMVAKEAVPESSAPKASKPKTNYLQPPKIKLTSTKPSKIVPKNKQKLIKETLVEPSPAKRSKAGLVGKRRKPKSPLKLVDEFADKGVPIVEPIINDEETDLQELNSRRFQPLLEVQRKCKEKVIEEQAARDLLTLHTPKKKSLVDQYIFQRHTSMTTGPSEKYESNRELTEINAKVQDEVQARSNLGKQDEGQARSNPGNAAELQPEPSHVENLKLLTEDLVILKQPASSTRTLSSLQNLKKELSFTNQFFVEKTQEEEPKKINAESEVQSMVMIPIHQDISLVPLMTTPILYLTTSQLDSPTINASLLTSTTTTITIITTTTLPPPPPHKKKRKKHDLPRTPSGSPPPQPPPPLPLVGASGAPGTSGASGSFQLPPPLLPYLLIPTKVISNKAAGI